ncbi:hypothetical protein LWC34_04985 [Kibdelosporangium philippinense]|uniref:CHAP domain-containing protein n=1 Tax=Kibdelosporangium philippinense TaxID=211113 RepID=A0ABS8Z2M8_9PSEU|nr:hypothetical protein [Kibdelosporangium philippinense]MCE7002183.1 hypothetical protein [Kibdelosporangium philippinense]
MKSISVMFAATLRLSLLSTTVTVVVAGATAPASHTYTLVTGHQQSAVAHQVAAEELIDHLNTIGWPAERKYNRYRQGREETTVRWGQPGLPATYTNVSRCASFVTETLKHTYSDWAIPRFFRTHFGDASPFARDYHDAIAGNKPIPHFKRVTKVTGLRPGDLIAIKYPEADDFTGHVVLVRKIIGREQNGPALDGASAYVLEVIDTTKAAHGIVGQGNAYRDTRITASTEETGAGYGHMVFYANTKDHTFAGYRWSVISDQIVPVRKHPVAAARISP